MTAQDRKDWRKDLRIQHCSYGLSRLWARGRILSNIRTRNFEEQGSHPRRRGQVKFSKRIPTKNGANY